MVCLCNCSSVQVNCNERTVEKKKRLFSTSEEFPSTCWIERWSGLHGEKSCSVFSWKRSTSIFVWVSCSTWAAHWSHFTHLREGWYDGRVTLHSCGAHCTRCVNGRRILKFYGRLVENNYIRLRCEFFPAFITQTCRSAKVNIPVT
jgi:hypothetical protein